MDVAASVGCSRGHKELLACMVGMGTGCLELCLDVSAQRESSGRCRAAWVSFWRRSLPGEVSGSQEWVLTTPRGVRVTSNLARASSSSLPSCCWQPSRLVLLLLSQFLMVASWLSEGARH